MFQDFLRDLEKAPEVFRVFLARDESSNSLAGARVIERIDNARVDHMGMPPIYGKRFSVHPDYRSKGIGKKLLDAGKRFCFDDSNFPAMFGESHEIGALNMYGREGAMYHLGSILEMCHRNSCKNNLQYFREFLTNPVFKFYRLSTKENIVFAYPRDKDVEDFLRENGYITKDELFSPNSQ